MHAFDKNNVSAEVLQSHFAETNNCFGKHVEICTDGSKIGESVACAVICGNQIKSMRLPDKSSVYTAELSAIRLALELIRRLKEKSFVIYSDSLSSLQAIQSFDIINITVFSILKLYTQLNQSIKTNLYSALRRRRIRGACWTRLGIVFTFAVRTIKQFSL